MHICERRIMTRAALLSAIIMMFWPSKSQVATIKFVKHEASKYTRHKSAIAAICLTESSAGLRRVGDDYQSFGIMQIQVPTVRWLAGVDNSISWTDDLSDYDVKKLLLHDESFSVEVACKYFEYYRRHGGFDYAIGMYNGGGLKNKRYIGKIYNNMKATRRVK